MSDTLSTLRALEAAATPGPWGVNTDPYSDYLVHGGGGAVCEMGEATRQAGSDAAFIAQTRNALPALLRVAEAARAFIELDKAERPGLPRDVSRAMQQLADALAALEVAS